MRIGEVRAQLHRMGNERYARSLQGFFKTGPGEYGEGDIFLGIRVPEIRKLAARSRALGADALIELLTIERIPEARRRKYLEGRI
jgi:hypothetical protein